jgi:hypothetical protein
VKKIIEKRKKDHTLARSVQQYDNITDEVISKQVDDNIMIMMLKDLLVNVKFESLMTLKRIGEEPSMKEKT